MNTSQKNEGQKQAKERVSRERATKKRHRVKNQPLIQGNVGMKPWIVGTAWFILFLVPNK
jgi:hypothetical protein